MMTIPWETLKEELGDKLSFGESVRRSHAKDESYHPEHLPDAVAYPEETADVVALARFSHAHGVPLVAYGAGSGLEGQVIPVRGGISVDFSRMNRVLEIRPDDFLVCVEPGVTRQQLNDALRPYGLMFPVDPGANASLGGMAATNASGTTAVRYGPMKANVRKLEVVLADGRVIEVGTLAAKSSSGYNLVELFVGSEGTLGLFTKLWLRVYGVPEATLAASAEFATVREAVDAVCMLIGSGLQLTRCELVTKPYIEIINRQFDTSYTPAPTLFLELSGSQAAVQADMGTVDEILRDAGAARVSVVMDERERQKLWHARHNAAYALMRTYPGLSHLSTDVCVPMSKLPEAVDVAETWIERLGIRGGIVGHVGDGNFHVSLMVNPSDPDDLGRAYELSHHLVEYALSVGGTCTGEHGVGLGKMKYQKQEHGEALALMQAVKRLFDPADMLNPGKLVDGIA
ncbi:FAD-binding oxidoreductase [Alicyclobacillus acidocaldarius]|uniref:D-lactate dehydrogenase (cytochrome) n=1 Tax=Alicyclobacillus acidocaldarius subsp. acidocaldarius (strain ATCC 27009 / DSM 446 / BCRC 14685 / JCM 5260 / KCTC 1825 / NBRC 15652 / NCIMB 11725 / NRRL B-14509 / 104-IA) TaxID=521098 RepID=C8WT16_ALIAD|nr:FAD-linked oxidase C-terminal domain-containing protein [Alicyclobacillus acidocaldarius]ACV59531.1 FAD linked oxidase domain protein [Alicyclobacillus acidocaldarius subsp. acidocaldarius DSM 446]